MIRFTTHLLFALALLALPSAAPAAPPQRLSDTQFQVDYSPSGITGIRRVNDKYDTNYIARGAALGDLFLRYRPAGQQQWKEASAAQIVPAAAGSSPSVSYNIGVPVPTIAESSRASASVRSFALFALGRGPAPASSHARQGFPPFEWTGKKGTLEWVEYDFAKPEKVWSTEVYWVVLPGRPTRCALPQSWRILYRQGSQWVPVDAATAYPIAADRFDRVAFAPVTTTALRIEAQLADNATAGLFKWLVNDQTVRKVTPLNDLGVNESFRLEGGALVWTMTLRNETSEKQEVGDLGLPLPVNDRYVSDKTTTYTRRVIQHAFIGGDGSFIYWMRANAEGPFLVMTPERGTGLEYFATQPFRGYTAYIHSAASAADLRAQGGAWNLPNTQVVLAPKGQPGDRAAYGFRFSWAPDYAGVREVLYRQGLIDTSVVPGMTVPDDLSALISLHTQNRIRSLAPQYPADTRIQYLGERGKNVRVYRVSFSRLGENMLTVNYGSGSYLDLPFFVTQPVETLIRKRAAFIVSHEQIRDPAKWYNGLFSEWDMKNQVLRSPDDLDSHHLAPYMVACDDPILGKAEFIAEANIYYPDPKEIAAVEYYIRHYVWGGLQETTQEKFPYAVYGIDNWKVNRSSPDRGPRGQEHVWRIYDYPHVFGMYYYLYRVAKLYPDLTRYLDAAGYLERAFGTAKAFFTVPSELIHWSAYQTGTYDELVIPSIVRALRDEGHPGQADWLEGEWQKKVEYFVNDKPDLFQSEYPFDSTGFQSTEALAKYAIEHVVRPGAAVPSGGEDAFQKAVSYSDAKAFLDEQMRLNIGDRGWLEPAYYDMGSDYRGGGDSAFTLSYMSQMGGWGVLDYGLHFAADPVPYLRLGYASYLSSWALVNAGTKASNYGYWYPGKNNDGGASGGFEPRPWGRVWFGNFQTGRGPWWYSGEIDLGFGGALRSAATIVTRDPIFGLYAYGGSLTRHGSRIEVVPKDGLRARFRILLGGDRVSFLLRRDGFERDRPIAFDRSLSRFSFTLENRSASPHRAILEISGLPQGVYQVEGKGRASQRFTSRPGETARVTVPVSGPSVSVTIVRSRSSKP